MLKYRVRICEYNRIKLLKLLMTKLANIKNFNIQWLEIKQNLLNMTWIREKS